jgi:intein/homing endonuclease
MRAEFVMHICSRCDWKVDEKFNGLREQRKRAFGWKRIPVSSIVISDAKIHKLDFGRFSYLISNGRKPSFPKYLTFDLAEEIGVHLGDGFLSDKRHDFRVKGDKNNEREYYDSFLKNLYSRIFSMKIKNKDYGDSYGFEVFSRDLWVFKTGVLGIPPGRKDSIRIPRILWKAGGPFLCSFLRGLFDTDGSFEFRTRYGRKNYYPVISLTCKSRFLAKDVLGAFRKLGFSAKMYKKSNGMHDVYLYGYSNFSRYEYLIGWSNSKNLRKVADFHQLWPRLCQEEKRVVFNGLGK